MAFRFISSRLISSAGLRRFSSQAPPEEEMRQMLADLRKELTKANAEVARLTNMKIMVQREISLFGTMGRDEIERRLFLVKQWLNDE